MVLGHGVAQQGLVGPVPASMRLVECGLVAAQTSTGLEAAEACRLLRRM